jgi:DNA-binding GntR family transcriptional regulator
MMLLPVSGQTVADLTSDGLLLGTSGGKDLDGGGLLTCEMPVPDHRAAVDRHLLRDTAHDRLCEAIVDGTLAPGESLHDQQLCGWLGLSRTPVRDALSRLRDEGLVEMAAQRFTRVSELTVRDVHEVVPLLAVVHGLATEMAVPRLGRMEIAALRRHNEAFVAALREHDGRAAYREDERFHGVFISRCGNPEVARVLERLTPRLHRVESLCRGDLPGGRSVAQHEALITRAETGDAPGAASAARANWMTLGGVLERAFAQA